MPSLNPYLDFDGTCAEAMAFYKDCLGGELRVMKVGDTPLAAEMPAAVHSRLMHASLNSGAITIMASDHLTADPLDRGNDVTLMLMCSSEAEIRNLFPRLSAGGTVRTPLKEEFWGAVYGDFTDRFGVRWMMNWDKPEA